MDSGIVLNELVRSYGATSVISNLNMHVEKGSIYGLLGPSGCGKTTLLKIILGRLVPDSGDVKILGKSPHTPGHFVPGSRVGYAPQELALYFDITIYETMLFHARMHGMSWPQFLDRKKWLYDFLELPDEHRLVRHLSGGQQRRLSLAVALLHNPELLVLDEPTVGVDPLLRLKIWDHLREIAGTGVTVIITTHYIEEARQADKVGLMRDGRLLAEGNPDTLMKEYNHDTLEGVFLDLCRGVKRENLRITSPGAVTSIKELGNTNSEYAENVGLLTNREKPTTALSWKRHLYHIVAISRRKFFQLSRTPLTLFFELLLPTVQIFLFMTCIGPSPKDLPFAVVNLDQGGSFRGQPINLGNDLVNYLGAGNELQLYNYTSLDSALGDVRAGIAWAVLYVPSNFSQDIFLRYLQPTPSNQSNLYFYVDLSNYQVDLILQQKVSDAFMSTANQLLNTTVEPVVTVPVYGKVNGKFSNFLAPGLITLIAFAHSIGMTAIAFVREKVECTIDRIFAAGVKPAAIIIGHFITNSVLLVVQVGVMLIVAIFAFEIPVQGSVFAVFTIVLALGVVGMSLGLFLSTVVNNETEGVMLALSTFFPSLLLSGILWPPQAIPVWLRWLSLIMPTTNAAEACRSVMIRGWGVSHVIVWRSYLISFAWMLGFLIFASLKLRTTDAQWFWQRNKSIERSKKRLDKI